MSAVTVLWSMLASACLVMTVIHGFVGLRNAAFRPNALLAVATAGTAFLALCELRMMTAENVESYLYALQWAHVFSTIVVIAVVALIRVNLRAGRLWMAWLICAIRLISLAINFVVPTNLNYKSIDSLRHIPFLGEVVSVPQGDPNPWMLLSQIGLLLLVVYVFDAAVTVYRRGDDWHTRLLAGTIVVFVVGSMANVVVAFWRIAELPPTPSIFFAGILAALAIRLGADLFRTVELSQKLQESETRLDFAASSAEAGLWSWDIESGRIWATEKARELYGFSPSEDLCFDDFLEKIHPEDRDRVRATALADSKAGSVFASDYRVALPDGASRWIRARAKAHLSPSGEPDRMLGVSLDIDVQKRRDDEMTELRLELAHLARVMMMSELSTSLAHEINQPLGAILNNASAAAILLTKGPERQEEVAAILTDIVQDAHRAGDVIRKIRGMVKRTDVQAELLQMNDIVSDVVSLYRGTIQVGNAAFRLDLADNLPLAKGDRVRLQQVLVNLCINAMDAMRTAEVREIVIRTRLDGTDTIVVSVSDTGSGISATARERMFEPFFTTKRGGLGMGLGICRSIIEEHRGRIWAENNETCGATVYFSLGAWKGDAT